MVRAGNFFGSGKGSWLDLFIAAKLKAGKVCLPDARLDMPTAWAYLPDLARVFVALAQARAQLAPFDTVHYSGDSPTGQDWLDTLTRIARRHGHLAPQAQLKRAQVPWWLFACSRALVPLSASLMETRYLWQRPHRLDDSKLQALLGQVPHTPFELAVQQSLCELGLVSAPVAAPALAA